MPIEHLAQLLLEHARGDGALPRRTPANDDAQHAEFVDDMYNRIEALPELRRETREIRLEPDASSPVIPAAEVVSNAELEELVSIALSSAQDAEDESREASKASRRARRGMFIAVGLATAGIVIACAATFGARLSGTDDQQMAEIAKQMQTLGALQHHINDQLAELQAQRAVQEASAAQGQPSVAPPQLGGSSAPTPVPLQATAVRTLPAEAAPQSTPPLASGRPSQFNSQPVTYGPAASPGAYPIAPLAPDSAPNAVYGRPGWPYHPPVRRYRAQVGIRAPVAVFVGSVQRDVRTLFR